MRNSEYFEYEYDEHVYYYTPDFIVDDKFVEVKGEQFIDEQGNLIPLLSKKLSNKKIKYLTQKTAAKFKCMLENNVQCISTKSIGVWTDEILIAKKYFEDHYKNEILKDIIKNRIRKNDYTK